MEYECVGNFHPSNKFSRGWFQESLPLNNFIKYGMNANPKTREMFNGFEINKNNCSIYRKISQFKVVDSCWIFKTKWSVTFRSFFVYGKEQKS